MVLAGTGVYGAAGAGVLLELWRRKMEPYAVCGTGSGAWPAALYAAGCDAEQFKTAAMQAQHMGKRMLRKNSGRIAGCKASFYTSLSMQRLLQAQTGGRILALCPRRTLFPLRSQRSGIVVLASPGGVWEEDVATVSQASAAFAARAAMGRPPFLEPLTWMGTSLLPMNSTGEAVRLLLRAGAQRILVVEPRISPQAMPDPLWLTALAAEKGEENVIPGAIRLVIQMPPHISTMSFGSIVNCMELGRDAAKRELDGLLECLGMAHCRVLPFKRG